MFGFCCCEDDPFHAKRFDHTSGKLLWQFYDETQPLHHAFNIHPVGSNGDCILGVGQHIFRLDANGEVIWKSDADGWPHLGIGQFGNTGLPNNVWKDWSIRDVATDPNGEFIYVLCGFAAYFGLSNTISRFFHGIIMLKGDTGEFMSFGTSVSATLYIHFGFIWANEYFGGYKLQFAGLHPAGPEWAVLHMSGGGGPGGATSFWVMFNTSLGSSVFSYASASNGRSPEGYAVGDWEWAPYMMSAGPGHPAGVNYYTGVLYFRERFFVGTDQSTVPDTRITLYNSLYVPGSNVPQPDVDIIEQGIHGWNTPIESPPGLKKLVNKQFSANLSQFSYVLNTLAGEDTFEIVDQRLRRRKYTIAQHPFAFTNWVASLEDSEDATLSRPANTQSQTPGHQLTETGPDGTVFVQSMPKIMVVPSGASEDDPERILTWSEEGYASVIRMRQRESSLWACGLGGNPKGGATHFKHLTDDIRVREERVSQGG